MNIGENIRYIRKKKKLTLKALGIKVGLSEQAIGQYERGDRKASIEVLDKIAAALDVSINDLLGYGDLEKQSFKEFMDKNPIEFKNNLFDKNTYDGKILSHESMEVISKNKSSKSIEQDLGPTGDIAVVDHEEESYELFKDLLISLGYDIAIVSPYLFKKIKSQIELEINYVDKKV